MASEVLELDSKGLCFLCLKACQPNFQSYLGPRTATSLKAFLQYLKLDVTRLANFQSDILASGGFSPQQGGTGSGSNVNLYAVLCESCISEMSKFLKLYQRWENIQFQMEQSCQKMHQLIDTGDTESGRRQEYRRRFRTRHLSDMFNASLLENLRKETKARCLQKNTRYFSPEEVILREDLARGVGVGHVFPTFPSELGEKAGGTIASDMSVCSEGKMMTDVDSSSDSAMQHQSIEEEDEEFDEEDDDVEFEDADGTLSIMDEQEMSDRNDGEFSDDQVDPKTETDGHQLPSSSSEGGNGSKTRVIMRLKCLFCQKHFAVSCSYKVT